MREVEIPICFENPETKTLQDLGILEVDIKDSLVRNVTFYRIDVIHPHKELYCSIYSGGEVFFSPMSYDEMKIFLKDKI